MKPWFLFLCINKSIRRCRCRSCCCYCVDLVLIYHQYYHNVLLCVIIRLMLVTNVILPTNGCWTLFFHFVRLSRLFYIYYYIYLIGLCRLVWFPGLRLINSVVLFDLHLFVYSNCYVQLTNFFSSFVPM